MKYRKWDSRKKLQIVLEGMQSNISVTELCNKHQISQGLYNYWLKEFQEKAHLLFDNPRGLSKEKCLKDENKRLKQIIADITVELKKTEAELNGEDL